MAVASYADRVQETTATTGTGTITLAGAVSGFQSFTTAFGANVTVNYCITSGTNWEVGQGVFTNSGTTLTRPAANVTAGSSGVATNITLAGTSNVFLVEPATVFNPVTAFTSSTTWTAPISGLVLVSGFGGGGGGGGGGYESDVTSPPLAPGGGGGGGSQLGFTLVTVAAGTGYTVTIGAGGSGGTGSSGNNGTLGANGGNTTFGSLATFRGASGGGSVVGSSSYQNNVGPANFGFSGSSNFMGCLGGAGFYQTSGTPTLTPNYPVNTTALTNPSVWGSGGGGCGGTGGVGTQGGYPDHTTAGSVNTTGNGSYSGGSAGSQNNGGGGGGGGAGPGGNGGNGGNGGPSTGTGNGVAGSSASANTGAGGGGGGGGGTNSSSVFGSGGSGGNGGSGYLIIHYLS